MAITTFISAIMVTSTKGLFFVPFSWFSFLYSIIFIIEAKLLFIYLLPNSSITCVFICK